MMRHKVCFFLLLLLNLEFNPQLQIQTFPLLSLSVSASENLSLEFSQICESVKDLSPQNPAIVFSISLGEVSCFSTFNPVPNKSYIYHNWYFRDIPTKKFKLSLKPPRWSTYSTIHLRESDIGPWRVEIVDQNGSIFKVLRFSITE